MRTALFVIGLMLGTVRSLAAQRVAVDPESAIARAALRPAPQVGAIQALHLSVGDTARRGLSQGEATLLGFLAGAGAGLLIAHIVVRSRGTSDDNLVTYLATPPVLGLFTAATVYIAMDD